jgi:hypothetical protein
MVRVGETVPLLSGRRSASLHSAVFAGFIGLAAVAVCFSAVAVWNVPQTVLVGKVSSNANEEQVRKQLDLARHLWMQGQDEEMKGAMDVAKAR